MNTTIIDFISNYGYLAVAILIAVENIFPPIPSEIILTFSGFLSISAHLNLGGLIIASTIGALVGAIVLYLLGKLISFEKLERLITGKWGTLKKPSGSSNGTEVPLLFGEGFFPLFAA